MHSIQVDVIPGTFNNCFIPEAVFSIRFPAIEVSFYYQLRLIPVLVSQRSCQEKETAVRIW